jgi:hypothetical protein
MVAARAIIAATCGWVGTGEERLVASFAHQSV